MVRKEALIELIQARLAGQFAQKHLSKFHTKVVEYAIGRVYNDILLQVYANDPNDIDHYTKQYVGVAVTSDSSSLYDYSDIPENIVMLPDARSGVRMVSTDQGDDLEFVAVTKDEYKYLDGLEVESIDSTVSYAVENDRVVYRGVGDSVTTVRMDLVIPFESYAYSDDIRIPSGQDMMLIERVVNLLMGTTPSDQLNDNNPK